MRLNAFDRARIDAIFEPFDHGGAPGVAVGLALGGLPVYRRSFGLASLDAPLLLTPSTRMRIGSTTKHLTALAFMLLCEEGKVDIDDPIGKFLPELPPRARLPSMRQIMGHVSGLRDVHDLCYVFCGTEHRPITSQEVLELYVGLNEVNAPPGKLWIYNNGAYSLLGSAIERIAGAPLEEVFWEKIFAPAGMYDTALHRRETDFAFRSAALHMAKSAGGFEKAHLGMEGSGQGGVVSSIDDLLRWLAHMDAPRVGNAETWELMATPQTLSNGISTGYGLGLIIGQYRGLPIVHHGGVVFGANAQFLKAPTIGLDLVVITNRHDASAIALGNAIIDACVEGLAPQRSPSEAMPATGVFRSSKTGRVVRLAAGGSNNPWAKGARQIASIDFADIPFERDLEGVLRPVGEGSFQPFAIETKGDSEKPDEIRLIECGYQDDLARQSTPLDQSGSAVAGVYRSPANRARAAISVERDGSTHLEMAGEFGAIRYVLEPLALGVWRAFMADPTRPWGGFLAFDEDGQGFELSTYRNRGVSFVRETRP